jgi:hypothetical protein
MNVASRGGCPMYFVGRGTCLLVAHASVPRSLLRRQSDPPWLARPNPIYSKKRSEIRRCSEVAAKERFGTIRNDSEHNFTCSDLATQEKSPSLGMIELMYDLGHRNRIVSIVTLVLYWTAMLTVLLVFQTSEPL